MLVTVGSDGKLSVPVMDARTNSFACAFVGPRDRRNALRWFVRMPEREDAERFPCAMGYDRKSVRFEPYMLYVDSPVPERTSVVISKVVCGSEVGKIDKTPIERWSPVPDETICWPAMPFSVGSVAPGQAVEFVGSSWWRRTPGRRRAEAWEPLERGPQMEVPRVMSVCCLVRMSWLPAKTEKHRFQFVPRAAAGRPPSVPVEKRAPRTPLQPGQQDPERPEEGDPPTSSDG